MDSCITRAEHEEFTKRMEAEHTRQNRRIELLERYGKEHTGRHRFCHRRGAGCGHCHDVDQIRRNTYEPY